jgi:hypothetical protein
MHEKQTTAAIIVHQIALLFGITKGMTLAKDTTSS